MNDPDQDATLIIPTGGRGERSVFNAHVRLSQAGAGVDLDSLTGINPLVAAANPIFCSIPSLRGLLTHPDPFGLRILQMQQISNFENNAHGLGIASENILVARYALCTFIDEAIAATPWGGTAELVRNSLLVSLHGETGGGEKFFQLLNRMAEEPDRNIDLLEFYYVCLALGFEGRFHVIEGGKSQLEVVRERLANLIKNQRGEYERSLSQQWRGEITSNAESGSLLPFWSLVAATALILTGVYAFYLFRLNAHSDRIVYSSVNPPKPAERILSRQKNISPRLTLLLADEIARGFVAVHDDVDESIVTIRGDGLFDSGSAELKHEYYWIINRITDSLNHVAGQVMVVGHTDNIPSRSIQFPSNWHLSRERAVSVARLIGTRLTGQRAITSEGRGETEPIASNGNPANRALNRRVEILLRVVH